MLDIKELQETARLGTAHTSESTNVEVQNVYHGKENNMHRKL
jgi:hypothetical protein